MGTAFLPGMPANNNNIFSSFNPSGFGGSFGGMDFSAIASGKASQPSSGGFGNLFGAPGTTNTPSFGGFPNFTSLGTNNLNPFTLFGGGTPSGFNIPGSPSTTAGPTGLPQVQGSVFKDLYGHGIGNALAAFLNSGAGFNSGVIQAEQNAAMPLEAKGLADLGNMFASNGLASSSTAALGYGDFLSQFNSQLENMYAQQYEQSVQNYLSVLTSSRQDAKEQNAQGGGIMSTLSSLGGLAMDLLPLFGV